MEEREIAPSTTSCSPEPTVPVKTARLLMSAMRSLLWSMKPMYEVPPLVHFFR